MNKEEFRDFFNKVNAPFADPTLDSFQKVRVHQEDRKSSSRLWIDDDQGNYVILPERALLLFKDLIIILSARCEFEVPAEILLETIARFGIKTERD